MKTHPNMTDGEWEEFLAAVPEKKTVSPEEQEKLLRNEGVTDEDFHWWNSMTKEEQDGLKRMLLAQNLTTLDHFYNILELPRQEALLRMYKSNIVYGDIPTSEQTTTKLAKCGLGKADYPFPWQLSDRIGKFMGSLDPRTEEYRGVQTIVQNSTSANAAIRLLMRQGVF